MFPLCFLLSLWAAITQYLPLGPSYYYVWGAPLSKPSAGLEVPHTRTAKSFPISPG